MRLLGAGVSIAEYDPEWTGHISEKREAARLIHTASAFAFSHTSSSRAPWCIIPADHKWFTRLAVAAVIVETLERLHLGFPPFTEARRRELDEARRLRMTEND